MKRMIWIWLALTVLAPGREACGQLVSQTLNLRQGWNAVFLEVAPEPGECDAVFAGKPVESVWAWNKRFSPVQYIQDPNTLLPGQPDWLTYVPPTDPRRSVVNLFLLEGGKPYLIKATSATTLTLRGRPVIRAPSWLADSFNLVGFYVSSNGPPTFQSLLAPSSAHAGQPIYRLSAAGTWQAVVSPSSTTVARGESYWIRSRGYSTYPGFLRVAFEQGAGLDFGTVLTETTLRIRNMSSNSTSYTLTRAASLDPVSTSQPALAGEVPLSYWRMNLAQGVAAFLPLTNALVSPVISAGSEWAVRLAVRRADMEAYSVPAGYSSARYQTILRLTDSLGSELQIPVASDGLQDLAATVLPAGGPRFAPEPVDTRAGLWAGSVALKQVSQAAVSQVPVPAASEFQFRVLLHVDAGGATRLLQKVVLAWTNGVAMTNAQGLQEAVSPGRYALLTDETLLGKFSGASLRDGTVTGRRMSTAAFGFTEPILATQTGAFGEPGVAVTCTVETGYDDPMNPFKHRYHPDHNNVDERYEGVRQECPEVRRQVRFEFTTQDPESTSLPGWGDNQLGGAYSETITGLHKVPVKVEGTFRIYRASRVAALNDLSF